MTESQTFTKKSLCAAVAQQLIIAAIERAKVIGKPMVIAIVDESGQLKAFHRMDGAALLSIDVAQNKAYSAVANAWGHATHEIYAHISKDPATLIGIPQIPRYTVFGGGYPIHIDGEIVGAIGISGGNVAQDRDVAEAALAILTTN
ncbi:MAG: heme-binding protein [Gammaproteobacteria bacterium]|nr:heme-binding protein [Gammaproteobacteria bacterium]